LKQIKNWIEHFGIGINRTHVSGHASSTHLKEFVEQVNAKTVIPIHAENAGLSITNQKMQNF
jgi:mRNA degradation ribonuclease J1/J2